MRTPPSEFFRFRMLTEVHCGRGIANEVAAHLDGLDTARLFVVVDPRVKAQGRVAALAKDLGTLGAVTIADGPDSEPDFEYLEQLKAAASQADPTLVVGIGGGSTMDAAKGLAIVLENDGPCEQYQGLALYKNKGRPCVAIPTLLGSGAEVTPSAVFFNRRLKKKGGINGPAVFPTRAIVDPALMAEAPDGVVAATAMDALVHAIESSVARCATSVTRMFAHDAARVLIGALDDLAAGRKDRAHDALAEGAFKAILSLMHSEQGLAGGASYPLGVHFHVPHGIGGGRCLPHAMMVNDAGRPRLYDAVAADAIGWSAGSGAGSAQSLAQRLVDLMETLDVPRLSKWLAGADLAFLAREVHGFRGVMEQNPVELSEADIHRYLERMLENETRVG